ncbi:hypothetical protein KKD62_03035 [Patescibacteria group bacterium]|nr:hypothetical protein [Patescibacteria group bacterium]MBU1931507.1 hypothetical protein [Patescibacteria group bacterium]
MNGQLEISEISVGPSPLAEAVDELARAAGAQSREDGAFLSKEAVKVKAAVNKAQQGRAVSAGEKARVDRLIENQRAALANLSEEVPLSLEKGSEAVSNRKKSLAELLGLGTQEDETVKIWQLAVQMTSGTDREREEAKAAWENISHQLGPDEAKRFKQRVWNLRTLVELYGIKPDTLLAETVRFSDTELEKRVSGSKELGLKDLFNEQLDQWEESVGRAHAKSFLGRVRRRVDDAFERMRKKAGVISTEDEIRLTEQTRDFLEARSRVRFEGRVDVAFVERIFKFIDGQRAEIEGAIEEGGFAKAIEFSLASGEAGIEQRKQQLAAFLGEDDRLDEVVRVWELAPKRRSESTAWQEADPELRTKVLNLRMLLVTYNINPDSLFKKEVMARAIGRQPAERLAEVVKTEKLQLPKYFEKYLKNIEEETVNAFIETAMRKFAYDPQLVTVYEGEDRRSYKIWREFTWGRDLGWSVEGERGRGLIIANLEKDSLTHRRIREVLARRRGRLEGVEAIAQIMEATGVYESCHEERVRMDDDARLGKLAQLVELGTVALWWKNIPGLREAVAYQDWYGFRHPKDGRPTHKEYLHKDDKGFKEKLAKHNDWTNDSEVKDWYWRFPDKPTSPRQRPDSKMVAYLRDRQRAKEQPVWLIDVAMSVMKFHFMGELLGNSGYKLRELLDYYRFLAQAGVGDPALLSLPEGLPRTFLDEIEGWVREFNGYSSGTKGWFPAIIRRNPMSPYADDDEYREVRVESLHYRTPGKKEQREQKRWQGPKFARKLGTEVVSYRYGTEQGGAAVIFDPDNSDHMNLLLAYLKKEKRDIPDDVRKLMVDIGLDPDTITVDEIRNLFNKEVWQVTYRFNQEHQWALEWQDLATLADGQAGHQKLKEFINDVIPGASPQAKKALLKLVKLELVLEQDHFWDIDLNLLNERAFEAIQRGAMEEFGQFHVRGLDFILRYLWIYWYPNYATSLKSFTNTVVRVKRRAFAIAELEGLTPEEAEQKAFKLLIEETPDEIEQFFKILEPKKYLEEMMDQVWKHRAGSGIAKREPYFINETYLNRVYDSYLRWLIDMDHPMVDYGFLAKAFTEGRFWERYYDPREDHPANENECLKQAEAAGKEKQYKLMEYYFTALKRRLINRIKRDEEVTQDDIDTLVRDKNLYHAEWIRLTALEQAAGLTIAEKKNNLIIALRDEVDEHMMADLQEEIRAIDTQITHADLTKLMVHRGLFRKTEATTVERQAEVGRLMTTRHISGAEAEAIEQQYNLATRRKRRAKILAARDAVDDGRWDLMTLRFYKHEQAGLRHGDIGNEIYVGFLGTYEGSVQEFLLYAGRSQTFLDWYHERKEIVDGLRQEVAEDFGYYYWDILEGEVPQHELKHLGAKAVMPIYVKEALFYGDREIIAQRLGFDSWAAIPPGSKARKKYGDAGDLPFSKLEHAVTTEEIYEWMDQRDIKLGLHLASSGWWELKGWVEKVGTWAMADELIRRIWVYQVNQASLGRYIGPDVGQVEQIKRDGLGLYAHLDSRIRRGYPAYVRQFLNRYNSEWRAVPQADRNSEITRLMQEQSLNRREAELEAFKPWAMGVKNMFSLRWYAQDKVVSDWRKKAQEVWMEQRKGWIKALLYRGGTLEEVMGALENDQLGYKIDEWAKRQLRDYARENEISWLNDFGDIISAFRNGIRVWRQSGLRAGGGAWWRLVGNPVKDLFVNQLAGSLFLKKAKVPIIGIELQAPPIQFISATTFTLFSAAGFLVLGDPIIGWSFAASGVTMTAVWGKVASRIKTRLTSREEQIAKEIAKEDEARRRSAQAVVPIFLSKHAAEARGEPRHIPPH